MSQSKVLYIARHAKSSWSNPVLSDFERPLNQRGVKNAEANAHYLREHNWLPEKIISSSAERARQTVLHYARVLGFPEREIEWNRHLYGAYLSQLLQMISLQNEASRSLMMVGHNPEMEALLLHLFPEAPITASGKLFTTGNIARLRIECLWREIALYQSPELALIRPKSLPYCEICKASL